MARTLDLARQATLLLGCQATDPPWQDLSSLGQEFAEMLWILVAEVRFGSADGTATAKGHFSLSWKAEAFYPTEGLPATPFRSP